MKTKIELVPVHGDLLTAFDRSGKSRHIRAGKRSLLTDHQVAKVANSRLTWRLAAKAAEDLKALDDDIQKAGGSRLRLMSAYRGPRVQGELRRPYDTWINAGRPDPNGAAYRRQTMSARWVAKPGESHHGWGGAIDIDVRTLSFPGALTGSDDALWMFRRLAAAWGWRPIITHPHAGQAEAGHFEHLGGVGNVGTGDERISSASPEARKAQAMVGCILAGTAPPRLGSQWSYIQARLLIGMFWCGLPTGKPNRPTLEALKRAGIEDVTSATPTPEVIGALNELRIGVAAIEAC